MSTNQDNQTIVPNAGYAQPLSKLISMRNFVLHLRGMTTSELCKTYPKNFQSPIWKGNKEEAVKDFLAIDAIQWKLTGEYAKFLSQKVSIEMFVPNADDISKVLFEGFEFTYNSDVIKVLEDKHKNKMIFAENDPEIIIEHLSFEETILLTDVAIRQIFR